MRKIWQVIAVAVVGLGLGLAVVQRIIKEFGGQIDVWSEPGKGTRFDIWLIGERPA